MLGETGEANRRYNVLVLGLLQTRSTDKSGRIIIYGDSNCIDASHLEAACYWMLDAMLEYTSTSHLPSVFKDNQLKNWEHTVDTDVPVRMEGNRLYRYSKVLEGNLGESQARPLPQCPHLVWAHPIPLNVSAPSNLYQSQKLLSLMEDVALPTINIENIIRDASGHENNEEADLWSWRNKQINSVSYKTENFNVTLTILVLLSVLVFCYWLRMYRPKPKKRKLCKRLINFMQCRRMSTV
jgi:hypothetical protein